MIKIAFFSFLIFIYTHVIACVIWFVLKEDYQWVAPTDFGNIRSRMQDPSYFAGYISDAELTLKRRAEGDMFMYQWLCMWYHSALSLGLVDVTARST